MDIRAIKFRLSGRSAMFKKPDVNSYAYFTYNNIHKVALLGLLGAIIGLKGYTHQTSDYPEFYEKLSSLKVAIVPDLEKKGIFSKKIQNFNNSVGYASSEQGGNLIVREQWLEDPQWDIYILEDSSEDYNKIKRNLQEGKTEYIPYLGKNDHPAVIDDVAEVRLHREDTNFIDSLVVTDKIVLGNKTKKTREVSYIFKEVVPTGMNKDFNFYEYKQSCLTNLDYIGLVDGFVYSHENYNLFFF
ncbi:type I-B CRISPR-associated protein Cas5b [Alkalibaculum bacchi]|uniref:type I-B CRISPR-associated protein Cas5b n=1 Tax=Alkalibaculum bacchi TaxID=645887 RepID=UPI0026EFEA54|nr:type I-B CRISPR-associated protein Cas5b [Alkalibaculum bacchi]